MESNSKAKPRRWITTLMGATIFVLESRAIDFIVNAYLVFLSIYILYAPPTRLIVGSALLILLPVVLAHALRVVVMLGRAMNVQVCLYNFTIHNHHHN